MLRATEASFHGVVFWASLQVPGGAAVAVADSELGFAAGVSMAVLVQAGGRPSLTRTTLATEANRAACCTWTRVVA